MASREFGIMVAKGGQNIAALLVDLAQATAIPLLARGMFAGMGRNIAERDGKREALNRLTLCFPEQIYAIRRFPLSAICSRSIPIRS